MVRNQFAGGGRVTRHRGWRRNYYHHLAASGSPGRLESASPQGPDEAAAGRVRHAFTGPAEPARLAPSHRAAHRAEPDAGRSKRSHRRQSRSRYQADPLLSPPELGTSWRPAIPSSKSMKYNGIMQTVYEAAGG